MNPRVFAAAGLVVLAAAAPAQPAPDFSLVDYNPNSARSDTAVSPRDYQLQVSAYYFGDGL